MKYIDKSHPYIEIPDTYEEYIKMKEDWADKMNTFITINHREDEIVYVRIGDENEGISNTYIMY